MGLITMPMPYTLVNKKFSEEITMIYSSLITIKSNKLEVEFTYQNAS